MDLTIAREMIDTKNRANAELLIKKHDDELTAAQLHFFDFLEAGNGFVKDCGFDGHFVVAGTNKDRYEAVGKNVTICDLQWQVILTCEIHSLRINIHLRRPDIENACLESNTGYDTVTLVNLPMKLANLMVTTENRCTVEQEKVLSVESMRTILDYDARHNSILRSRYITEDQKTQALAIVEKRKAEIEVAVQKNKEEQLVKEALYQETQRVEAIRNNLDKAFLDVVIKRIEENNWQPFELWMISYVPKDINVVDEEGERLSFEDMICTIYSKMRMPNPSGLFDKVYFLPYHERPISLEGPILDKESIRVMTLADKNIPQNFIRSRSFKLPGTNYIQANYRTPYFVNDPILPSEEQLTIWRKNWDESLKTT